MAREQGGFGVVKVVRGLKYPVWGFPFYVLLLLSIAVM